jgi:hypothetical protein
MASVALNSSNPSLAADPSTDPTQQWAINPRIKEVAKAIFELAVRILFILGAVMIAAALAPAAIQAAVLIGVALGATLLAAFFFGNDASKQEEEQAPLEASQLFAPDQKPTLGLAEELEGVDPAAAPLSPPEAPRGIRNRGGNDCFLNATLQLLNSSATFRDWIRKAPNLPANLLPLREFYQKYDQAQTSNKPIIDADSRQVRRAISAMNPHEIRPSTYQEDAHAALSLILEHMPANLQAQMRESVQYHNNPPMNRSLFPHGVKVRDETSAFFKLSFPEAFDTATFKQMWDAVMDEVPHDREANEWGEDGKLHRYKATHIRRHFVHAPTDLWIQLGRSAYQKPTTRAAKLVAALPFGMGESLFPNIKEHAVKYETKVDMPEEIQIQPLEGPVRTYRLTAHVNHIGGTPHSGHYKAYQTVGTQVYCCNDDKVRPISSEEASLVRSQGYLFHYERVLLPGEKLPDYAPAEVPAAPMVINLAQGDAPAGAPVPTTDTPPTDMTPPSVPSTPAAEPAAPTGDSTPIESTPSLAPAPPVPEEDSAPAPVLAPPAPPASDKPSKKRRAEGAAPDHRAEDSRTHFVIPPDRRSRARARAQSLVMPDETALPLNPTTADAKTNGARRTRRRASSTATNET